MSIALPVLSSENVVKLPAPPANPPTDRDICLAHSLTTDIMEAHCEGKVTDADLANALIYKHMVLAASAAARFLPVDEPKRTQGLQNDIRDTRDDVCMMHADALKEYTQAVNQEVKKLNRICTLIFNRAQSNDNDARREIAPLPNEEDATTPLIDS
ncbi:hypothetical protein BD779DRAFT_1474972 [Infundibulicybe gibba]|nr:hypothetical protein BD779DRAFT_1474972 [Infundibulicybe gibba]